MATITGINGKDKLTGTAGDDIFKELTSYDESDSNNYYKNVIIDIDGGAGNDTVDYRNLGASPGENLTLNNDGSFSFKYENLKGRKIVNNLKNIETVIGQSEANGVSSLDSYYGKLTVKTDKPINIDLSTEKVTYSSSLFDKKTIFLKNFRNVFANPSTTGSRVKGNDFNNVIELSRGTVIGSKGDDKISGSDIIIDYRNLGAIKLSPTITTYRGGGGYRSPIFAYISFSATIDKSGFGIDKVENFGTPQKIIGASNKENTIDGTSTSTAQGQSLDVNLATNSLTFNLPPVDLNYITSPTSSVKIEVLNFVNVIGSKNNDKIVGANKKGKLTGGGGNDSIAGGSKNDIITGSDSTARGVGELDTLTGGGGRDKFVLGDKNGAYYVGKGNNDYALITDFNVFKDSISIGSLKNYSFALAGNNTIDLYSGKDVKTRDLIAKIQIAGGISTVSSNAKSAMSPDASLNALVGKINIISG